MNFFFSLVLLFSATSHALETDNYLVLDKELKDSSSEVNYLFDQEINSALKVANNLDRSVSCREITFRIADRFKTYPPLDIFIEDWLLNNLNKDQLYPLDMDYIKKSIYQNSYGVLFKRIPLSPSIQVNNIYFGTDKLSHFTSTARRYLKKYLKKLQQGYSEEDAVKSAIEHGMFNETTILGLKFIGVYSYGDLEANFQGFLFYKNLCLDNTDPYLTQNDFGKWIVRKSMDIRKYANPYWDETFNLSYRSQKNWFHTSKIIKTQYCDLLNSEKVQERFNYYRQLNHSSTSLKYIKSLQLVSNSRTPNPYLKQSIESLCGSSLAESF